MPEIVSHQISFGVAAGKNVGTDNKLSPQPPSKQHQHGDDMQKQQ